MSAFLAFVVGLLWDSIWLRLAWKILAPKFGWKKKALVREPVQKKKPIVRLRPARIPNGGSIRSSRKIH